ncbi:MAG TPA: hypothetical protein VEG44_06160 [Candidatus Acidoferrales bacterium]|nr:hypothetical protein [Candidatus Acidoferrales bacterium]
MKRARKKLDIAVLIAVLGALSVATGAALWALYTYTMISPTPILVP